MVIEASQFNEGGWVTNGAFTSDALRVTERFTRVDRDQINYEAVIEDPKVFTEAVDRSHHTDASGRCARARVRVQ